MEASFPNGGNDSESDEDDLQGEGQGAMQEDERSPDSYRSAAIHRNYVYFSLYCAAVPACALACLALATARLGSEIGAWQSGILYASYTGASVLGIASWTVQQYGSKQAVIFGQMLFGGGYVGCFWLATATGAQNLAQGLAWAGAGVGGVGAAILWTGQGVYFAEASEQYTLFSGKSQEISCGIFSGIFAVCLLIEETIMDVMSTFLVKVLHVHWGFVFALYAVIALIATWATRFVDSYPQETTSRNTAFSRRRGVACCSSDATATVDLLIRDSRLKYMMGFNAAFGLAGAFLNSFVSGEAVPLVFDDASYVGLLVALHGFSAALASAVFAKCHRKGAVLVAGSLSFLGVALPFLVWPNVAQQWTWRQLALVYILEGVGRATFEGNLKAIFAEWFHHDREAAFANITLQNGLASAVAYILTTQMQCSKVSSSQYCVMYSDGSHHNVGDFASLMVGASIASILGYWRAKSLDMDMAAPSEETSPFRQRATVEFEMTDCEEKDGAAVHPLSEIS